MWRTTAQDDTEQVIEKSETSSSTNSDEAKLPKSLRGQLEELIHTKKFQIAVIVLVVVDCLLVLGEILIDFKVFENDDEKCTNEHKTDIKEQEEPSVIAAEVFHYCSIAILTIFLLELFLKLFAMGKTFFQHKMEVFDGIIVVVSFALDIAFIDKEQFASAVGLLVILRLWRIGRIINGAVLSVKAQSEKEIAKERKLREAAEAELVKFREYCAAQEREIEALQLLLSQNNIQFQKMEKPNLPISTIDVVAEVNQYIEATRMTASD